jgi:hypothetical protein
VKRRPALLAALCVAAATLTAAEDARAWYFPEHAVIAHDGLTQLPPPLRAVLEEAVRRARSDGLELCERVDVGLDEVGKVGPLDTRMLHTERDAGCVPYVVLSALAGDHASSAAELRSVLTTPKGIELTSTAAYEWGRFQQALGRLPNASLERMAFVHALDVAFYFIDPGYELRAQGTQAHFTLGGLSLADVVTRIGATGDVDSALGQFLVHHLRSLQLASQGRPADAILEHAFAMHFLQDSFAAGHLVMTEETWKSGNAHARRRHDFFNAKGLAVGRALSVEPCATLGAGLLELSGLSPCWVTTGDGYLGLSADASDRQHAAGAVAKAELFFALALDSARVVGAIEALGEREQLALGELVEPVPWWTLDVRERRDLPASAARTLRLVRAAARAMARLKSAPELGAVRVGSPPLVGRFAPGLLDGALSPCVPADRADVAFSDGGDPVPCGAGRALALGTPGVSLLRPLLVDLPASQLDPSRLEGQSKEDLGWAAQLLASVNSSALFPPHAPVDFFAPAVGVAAGISYRWGTYLPGRLNRSIVEMNVGVSESLHFDSHGRGGGNPQVTMFDQELRWPVLWELLTSYALPLDLAKGHDAGRLVFLSGARVHELVTPTPVFFGLELEVAALALSQGSGSYPLYTASPELRLYAGAANPSAAQPSFPGAWGPTVGIELTGGYATFF